MKPRHATTAHLEHVDCGYVCRFARHPNYPPGLFAKDRIGDRRDADLMWDLARTRLGYGKRGGNMGWFQGVELVKIPRPELP